MTKTIRQRLAVLEAPHVLTGAWKMTLAQWIDADERGLSVDEQETEALTRQPGRAEEIKSYYDHMRERLAQLENLDDSTTALDNG